MSCLSFLFIPLARLAGLGQLLCGGVIFLALYVGVVKRNFRCCELELFFDAIFFALCVGVVQ